MINFGSDIRISGIHNGTEKYTKYKWVAYAWEKYTNTIFLCKNKYWFELGDKRMVRNLKRVLTHETIHNILWYDNQYGCYDFMVGKFRRRIKKECPKTYGDYLVF